MAIKRTPEPEDAEALRYTGILGHRYATTLAKSEGGRTAWLQSDTIPTLARLREDGMADREPRTFEQVRFASKSGRKWRRVR